MTNETKYYTKYSIIHMGEKEKIGSLYTYAALRLLIFKTPIVIKKSFNIEIRGPY